jgi:hypothetical protein
MFSLPASYLPAPTTLMSFLPEKWLLHYQSVPFSHQDPASARACIIINQDRNQK